MPTRRPHSNRNARAAAADPTPFRWRENMACVATYNVLEHDDKMDQFEDADVAFDDAAGLQMGQLRFWPGVSLPAGAIDSIARLKAQEFLFLIQKNFTSKKQDPSLSSGGVIRATGKVFATRTATLADLAELVDASFRFPDEP
jgi:hypothetical protein